MDAGNYPMGAKAILKEGMKVRATPEEWIRALPPAAGVLSVSKRMRGVRRRSRPS